MGNETIFYYVTEESITGQKRIVKPHFWRKMKFPSFVVEKEELTVAAVMVPTLQKGWKSEKLHRLMQENMEAHPLYSGNVRILIQPDVQLLLTERNQSEPETLEVRRQSEQSDTFLPMSFPLAERILRERFPLQNGKTGPESVVLLLGELFFPEEQIRHFEEMIQPYLTRINALTVIYGADRKREAGSDESRPDEGMENQNGMQADEIFDSLQERGRLEAVIREYTEELYYEYGLVSQVMCGGDVPVRRRDQPGGQRPVFFMDYGYPGTQPLRMLKEGDIYLDVASSEEKQALFRRKYRGIFYQSPRKYLDTMVKSGYDK